MNIAGIYWAAFVTVSFLMASACIFGCDRRQVYTPVSTPEPGPAVLVPTNVLWSPERIGTNSAAFLTWSADDIQRRIDELNELHNTLKARKYQNQRDLVESESIASDSRSWLVEGDSALAKTTRVESNRWPVAIRERYYDQAQFADNKQDRISRRDMYERRARTLRRLQAEIDHSMARLEAGIKSLARMKSDVHFQANRAVVESERNNIDALLIEAKTVASEAIAVGASTQSSGLLTLDQLIPLEK